MDPPSTHLSLRNKNFCSHKYLHTNVYRNLIFNLQKLEMTQVFFQGEWIANCDTSTQWSCSAVKEQTNHTWKNLDKPQRLYARWKNPVSQDYIQCISTLTTFWKTKNYWSQDQLCGCQEVRVGEDLNTKSSTGWIFAVVSLLSPYGSGVFYVLLLLLLFCDEFFCLVWGSNPGSCTC
jgi:hypothetical protein